MAGIVALVGGDGDDSGYRRALELLRHHEVFRDRTLVNALGLRLGVVYRANDPPSDVWIDTEQLGVVVYGFALKPGAEPTRAAARDVARLYLEGGVDGVCRLDGGFVVAILDLRRAQLVIVNDRTATVPMQYGRTRGACAIAPEAKAIFPLLGTSARLDDASLVALLSMGHALGDATLFEGIRLFGGAQVVTIPLATAELTTTTYWRLTFRSDRGLGEAAAADQLYEALVASHRAATVDRPERTQLLLTGGYDSRTVLGILARIDRRPDECLTWGLRDDIPLSDPSVARALAADFDTPWRFLPTAGEDFAANAASWAYVSELGSANLGSFGGGALALYGEQPPAPAVLIGDQMLGSAGLPLSRRDAVETTSGVPRSGLAPGLRPLVRPGAAARVGGMMIAQLERLAARCPNDAPKDLQDFLGFEIRLARWLNAPTYFREPMTSPRRPMLLQPVLDVLERLPPALRVEKRVLVAMLARRFPELQRHPKESANSLIDWELLFSGDGAVASLFQRLLTTPALLDGPLRELVDPDAVRRLATEYRERSPRPVSRQPAPERMLAGLRRSAGRFAPVGRLLRAAERGWRAAVRQGTGASTDRVAMRLAVAGLLHECVATGRFDGSVVPRTQGWKELTGEWQVERALPPPGRS